MTAIRQKHLKFQKNLEGHEGLDEVIAEKALDNIWIQKSNKEMKKMFKNLENEIMTQRYELFNELPADEKLELALRFGLRGEGPSQPRKRPASPAPHGEGPAKTSKLAMVDPTGDSD
jgi:hypothetical protein